MNRFTGKLALIALMDKTHPVTRDGRTLWGLERELSYPTAAGDTITIPAGFQTDLASIPRLVSNIFPPDGPWTAAAVVHDFLYATRGTGLWYGRRGVSRTAPYSRSESDGILREAMEDLGVTAWKRSMIWAAVRVGGAHAYGT